MKVFFSETKRTGLLVILFGNGRNLIILIFLLAKRNEASCYVVVLVKRNKPDYLDFFISKTKQTCLLCGFN